MSPRKAAALRDTGDGRSLREHLIGTAADLISAHGTAELTVRAIARAAGVADGVLYNHFADKEELLADALAEHVRRAEAGLGELPAPGSATVEDNLRAQLAYGLALHKEILPAFAGLLARPAVLARFGELAGDGGTWRDRLAGYLRAEKELGRLDGDVDAAAAMLVGVCHESVLAALLPHGPGVTTSPATEAVVKTVLEGIAVR
ncbi:TetR/AcrR family transcriptional regulator [Amycolatopsis sp. EV170708-02-1]|uniref:TetR/AcrR family transcriptional regulator n=1 Tax=Amycolatopsis sp. EV170708-02-1 TaxID=2919322 RepID=UPI001F0C6C65|nr:TetR/AcrR family transcriptional regulator [Amycolatopsis sp. EV170708-02-1]UMO99438.1 TetR/AcrR family transcriptional regulator [Amycolatopsis sp. EV170708-02-1]